MTKKCTASVPSGIRVFVAKANLVALHDFAVELRSDALGAAAAAHILGGLREERDGGLRLSAGRARRSRLGSRGRGPRRIDPIDQVSKGAPRRYDQPDRQQHQPERDDGGSDRIGDGQREQAAGRDILGG